MKEKVNAFVLAGEGGASRSVYGTNKAFLTIKGNPIFLYVLAALDRVDQIRGIYLIGPRLELSNAIEKGSKTFRFEKEIRVIEQRENLLANLVHVFACSLPEYCGERGFNPADYSDHRNNVGLFVSADIPLLIPEEVSEFLSASDMDSNDYCMGVTSENVLAHYYPREGMPGIRMTYFYLREKAYRINNLHLARPFKISRAEYVEKMYEYRYQRRVRNVVRIAWEILGTRRWIKGIFFYILVKFSIFFSSLGLRWPTSVARVGVRLDVVESAVSEILGTRFKTVETTFGGAALDVDNEKDYKTIDEMFDLWRAHEKTLSQERYPV
ncbi:MAG TPA: hypothetical protein VFG95_07125 [Nitrospiria bacterium]|nr:hypothetical protein [Nitrospiria bacterium]